VAKESSICRKNGKNSFEGGASHSAYTAYMELFFSDFTYKINFEGMLIFWLVSSHLNEGR
jgi:hypothetical protein